MYYRILFPTDGSDAAAGALAHALSLANAYGAELHVLHVVDLNGLPLDAHSSAALSYVEAEGERALADAVARAEEAGVDTVVSATRSGSPHEELLGYVDEENVDLVVMGTHGRRGVARAFFGSVTMRTVRLSPVPVLVVRQTGVEGAVDEEAAAG